nr:hypothetical protein [Burkholderia anthina]
MAVAAKPSAVAPCCVATDEDPTAVPWNAALVEFPIAVLKSPLAVDLYPYAELDCPLAVANAPTAVP